MKNCEKEEIQELKIVVKNKGDNLDIDIGIGSHDAMAVLEDLVIGVTSTLSTMASDLEQNIDPEKQKAFTSLFISMLTEYMLDNPIISE